MSCRHTIEALARRYQTSEAEALEDYHERAAIREYLAGFSRTSAEVWSISDVERMLMARGTIPPVRVSDPPLKRKMRRRKWDAQPDGEQQ